MNSTLFARLWCASASARSSGERLKKCRRSSWLNSGRPYSSSISLSSRIVIRSLNRSTMNGSFLRRDDPDALVQSGDADAKTLGRVFDPDGRVFQQGTNLLFVFGGELFRAATQASAGACCLETGHCPLTDYIPFKLSQRRED